MIAEGFEGLDQKEADARVVAWLERARTSSRSASRTATRSARASAATPGSSRSSRRSGGAAMDELARPAIEALRERPRPLPPREPAPLRDRVARAGAGLVHLASALVGAPDPDLDVPGRAPHLRVAAARGMRRVRRGRSSSATPTCSTHGSRPRSGRSRRSAGPTTTPELARYYPGDVNVTARDIIRLWENRMIFAGLVPPGRDPVHGRDHPRRPSSRPTGGGCRRASAPASTRWSRSRRTAPTRRATACSRCRRRRTSATRRRAIEEGRKLANKLWNVARLILQTRRAA